MHTIQTLTLDKKKFAVIPFKEYQSLLDTIEDLKDLQDIKKRKQEKRVSIADVKKKLLSKSDR